MDTFFIQRNFDLLEWEKTRYALPLMPSFHTFGKICAAFSGSLVLASIILLIVPGPKLSIDFTGGSLLELKLPEGITKEEIVMELRRFDNDQHPLGNVTVSATREKTFLLRLRTLSVEEHSALLSHIQKGIGDISELQFTTIGPTVGSSLRKRAVIALILSMIAIVLYVAFAFRNIPKRYNPWKFGIIAVLALIHDVLITTGVFVILSHTTSFEFDTLFVTALLTITGYSVNDTIIIFDRIRENLSLQNKGMTFDSIASQSLWQSLTRSFNTSISTLIMLLFLFLLGPANIRWFILALIIGFVVGTYSSIGLATPLLVYWRGRQD